MAQNITRVNERRADDKCHNDGLNVHKSASLNKKLQITDYKFQI